MVGFIQAMLDQASEHAALVLVCVVLFAAIDAAMGIGVILPDETGVVLAAVALSDQVELVALAIIAAAVGAFVGDHFGFVAVCGLAAALWATGWAVGGTVVGNALLEMAEQYALPTVAVVIAVGIITVLVHRRFTRRLT